MNKKIPELLIPAGDLEKLQTAVRFGADAVYVGGGEFSLRSAEYTSFNLKELEAGVVFAHKHGVKVYLAMNIFPVDQDLPKMIAYLKKAIKIGIDAVIVSDVGMIDLVRKLNPKLKIHLSTQANTLNSAAVKYWQAHGVRRIVLGRELSLSQVKKIRKAAPKIELELFVHGAMCISYSGRCLLSKHLTGRSANRGECAYPCRTEFRLKDNNRPEEEFLIEEDKRGTYILNSKDLCLIEHLPELIKSGVDSFKIEGRMKSVYYVAAVTKVYREALDLYAANPQKYKYDPQWGEELAKISHRNYSTGFYLNETETENIVSSKYIRGHEFVGVTGRQNDKGLELFARNRLALGDELEVLDPACNEIKKLTVRSISKGNNLIEQAHSGYHVFIKGDSPCSIGRYSLLRKKR